MFLNFEVKQDNLTLMVLTGPTEKYDPKQHKDVTDLFKKIKKLDADIKKMREKIDPRIAEISESVRQFNLKHAVDENQEE